MSALILALIAAGAATAFISTTHASAFTRLRSDAQSLAQQDQNRLRGMNIDELSNLSRTLAPVSLDGASFTVQESASYVSDGSSAPSCTNPSADYLKVTSTVTWSKMGSAAPITVSSILTPVVGSVDPTHGTLAVSVINAAGSGVAGMNVSISGASSASGQTATGGCVLFGDLPSGDYNVSVTPPSGTYVDAHSGQAVSVTTPDVVSATVTAGSTASSPTQFQLDKGGSATFTFTNVYPAGVNPTTSPPAAAAPAVVLYNTNLTGQNPRICSAVDTTGCPAVGAQDTSFPANAWSASVTATPLFPYAYASYAGVCKADDAGGADGATTVTAGGSTSTPNLKLPAMVVRLFSGTPLSAAHELTSLPAGAHLVITDTGCGMRYIGSTTAVVLSAGVAVLPLGTVNAAQKLTANDTGLLRYPGMPYGSYTVCYDNGTNKKTTAITVPNQTSGEIVNVNTGSAATSATLC